MALVIILVIVFLFVVKSSSRKDGSDFDPSNTGHYTRLRRRNREINDSRRIKRDRNNRI